MHKAVLALGLLLACAGLAAGKENIPMAMEAFDLSQVRLGEGPCREAQEANRRYLHALDAERLLYNFRCNAGLSAPGQPLGGWEAPDCEVRGHFVGHYLSACALMYASTGDEQLRAKAEGMVAELAKCQQALGGGYLSAFPESFWARLESMQQPPWAPYYTIHKIMAGLRDVHRYCGSAQALQVLRGMASYFEGRRQRLSGWQWDQVLGVEFGGMSEVLHDLYALTGERQHLELAHAFDRASFLGPLALEPVRPPSAGHDNLTGLHANTHIPVVCGAARHYELTGDERYRRAVSFFWERVVGTRCYATGGTSQAEHWGEPGRLADTLAADNQESCTTYNMLKLTRYLLRWTGEARYADYYERAYYNGILGTQQPVTGMLAYFLPLAAGSAKSYGTPEASFWCCYGTGIESFAKLGDSIYCHDGQGLYVNLFIASTLDWRERGVRLEQVTRFPEEQGTTLIFHTGQPVRLALRLRVPAWARGAQVRVNGEAGRARPRPGRYLCLEREWREGDRVELRLPMSLQAEPMPDDPELAAITYGPLVLAGLADGERHFLADSKHLDTWIKPVAGQPLTFRTVGQPADLTLVPLHRVVDERYGVYWVITREGSPRHRELLAAERARREREARVVDRVVPVTGEAEHGLQGQDTGTGSFGGQHWRHATGGGWWSWELAVLPDQETALACTYWGSEAGPRTFDILVDGQAIATQTLGNDRPGKFFEVEYPLPRELTRGKARVTVRFQAHPGCVAGGVFECATLRPAGK